MSGHSKWSTIKRQKGSKDIKRGQIFTKLSNAITVAVRQGGGITDPESNFRLRLAIEAARSGNMPKDNIERAVQRAAGKQGDGVEEALFEGFGPGGFCVIVDALTDNKQRTFNEVKHAFDKNGGILGNSGSVLYQFEKRGIVSVLKNGKTLDEIFFIAADCFAEDVEDGGDEVFIYTKPEDLARSQKLLKDRGLEIGSIELGWKPRVITPISDSNTAEKALTFLEKIDSLDDVQKVYANFDIPENLMRSHSLNE